MIVRVALISLFIVTTVHAQRLVDPSKVAPEFREAAEKRRAEQLRQQACAKQADAEKILPRDRLAFLNNCLGISAAK
ncbi:MAG: hypothetical protein Q7T45_23445 [Bradyrhizobium sp.]|nr:hypothetical protein [Bradyrhizobium sp.]MDO8400774.1 hypothetical protein [Bradyrhizobium sp.]